MRKMKKLLTSVILTTGLLVPTIALASDNNLWSNPTEYYSMPNGTEQLNKSERLVKGHTYKVSFDAETYGENVLLLYTQNKSYLNQFLPLTGDWAHYEYTFYAKTNTRVVFEDLQSMGDINIKNIRVELVK
jgi:hypothetical protein